MVSDGMVCVHVNDTICVGAAIAYIGGDQPVIKSSVERAYMSDPHSVCQASDGQVYWLEYSRGALKRFGPSTPDHHTSCDSCNIIVHHFVD